MMVLPPLLAMAGLALAHMEMTSPPPFRSKFNPHTTDIDYSMTNPLHTSGSDFPCKGYHALLATPQGASVATWAPGSRQTLSLTGSAVHNGGSCQASLSYDGGATFRVVKSWVGGCPLKPDWAFTVPADAPRGAAVFAWSWFNNLGNRELYMNCAHVTIAGAGAPPSSGAGLPGRPGMLVANVGRGCATVEGSDVLFPEPGPDVENVSRKSAPPVGDCVQRQLKV